MFVFRTDLPKSVQGIIALRGEQENEEDDISIKENFGMGKKVVKNGSIDGLAISLFDSHKQMCISLLAAAMRCVEVEGFYIVLIFFNKLNPFCKLSISRLRKIAPGSTSAQ